MKGILLISFLFFSNFMYANDYWKQNYSKIDSFAYTIKPTTNIDKLTAQLIERYSTDAEKYRSIFAWITHNIAYDVVALKNPALKVTDAVGVIKKKKTVCQGYCNLFLNMCTAANIECVIIMGWSHEKLNIGKPLVAKPTHAWNAIKINNEWYVCDVTWAAGSTSEENSLFTFKFKDFYFCTPPELFSCNHFPEETKWLLGTQLSSKDFIDKPHFYPEAININLKDLTPINGIQVYKQNKKITFTCSVDVDVKSISICPSNAKFSTAVKFSQENNTITFEYDLATFSPYINIFLNNKSILAYKITAK